MTRHGHLFKNAPIAIGLYQRLGPAPVDGALAIGAETLEVTRVSAFARSGMKGGLRTRTVKAENGESEKEKPDMHGYFAGASKRSGLGFRYGRNASKRKSISAISSAFSFSSEKMGFSGTLLFGPY